MTRHAPKTWVIGAAMVLSAWLGVALQPERSAAARRAPLESIIPLQFGEWRVESRAPAPLIPTADLGEKKEYTELLVRTYRSTQGEQVMLSIAYNGEQRGDLKAHRPEFCYRGQGFDINTVQDGVLATRFGTFTVRRLLARSWRREEPITYWMTIGDEVKLPGIGRHMAMFAHGLSGEIADGMLVRVSSLDPDAARAWRLHERFVAALLEGLPARDRARLAGLGDRP